MPSTATGQLMVDAFTAIGFDFGLYHIGIAVGQSITMKANPLGSIAAQKGRPDWQAIDQLIQKWQPQCLIVGMPYALDGSSHQAITQATIKFIDALTLRYPDHPVHAFDERYTTQLAKTALVEAHGSKALTKKNLDAWSAKMILEEWLLTQN